MPDALPPFDPTVYYRFANVKYTSVTLSTGFKDSSPNLTFTPAGSRSSENWQLYFQAGRYLIRNYDYGASAQLGLSDAARSVPRLLAPSGALGQQWLLDQYEDGSWRVSNGLVGNVSVLGVSDALVTSEIGPGMMPSPDGSDRWLVTVNLSAGKVGTAMLVDVEGLEVRTIFSILPFSFCCRRERWPLLTYFLHSLCLLQRPSSRCRRRRSSRARRLRLVIRRCSRRRFLRATGCIRR
jgi:hypothetical protein